MFLVLDNSKSFGHIVSAMSDQQSAPFLVVTVLQDSSARSAAITRSLGDAVERAMVASSGKNIAGVEVAELPIHPKAFAGLRKKLNIPEEQVAIYDVFPMGASVPPELRKIAGQFLAAEALWQLEEQGMLDGVPPGEKLDLPKGWSKDPKEIRQKLVDAGAHNLSDAAVHTYREIKSAWDGRSSG